MTETTRALRRDLSRWAAMSPKAIAEGSPAQFMHAMADAQHDIAVLAAEVKRLRAFRNRVKDRTPYPLFCHQPERCAGTGRCQAEIVCND